jgi:tRNA(fMet)-specific endonuclease VapC
MNELRRLGAKLTTTQLNAYELYHGCYDSAKPEKNLAIVKELLTWIDLLQLDDASCQEAGRIVSQLEADGTIIGDMDTIIAAIAIRHGETLMTRNLTHFEKVTRLSLESW